jgi:K+-sensing histidine kinase KdpD
LVQGDRIQLQQVIINLVINAAQAMATVVDHTRVVTIQTQEHEAHDVLVVIRDAGIGMAPESLDRLFSPFYTTKPEGLGLGLSICRSIVEAHGGQIWAARNAGPGMTFKCAGTKRLGHLPIVRRRPLRAAAGATSARPNRERPTIPRIGKTLQPRRFIGVEFACG